MKKIIALALAVACAATSFAWADGHGGPGGQDRYGDQQWQGSHPNGQQRGPGGDHNDGRNNGYPQGNDRGPGPHGQQFTGDHHMEHRDYFRSGGHDFRQGRVMPEEYRGNHYRVNDWRDRGLPEPPNGNHWSYIDGNYVLVAAATGIISAIIYSAVTGH